jgi:hypothetical protein
MEADSLRFLVERVVEVVSDTMTVRLGGDSGLSRATSRAAYQN